MWDIFCWIVNSVHPDKLQWLIFTEISLASQSTCTGKSSWFNSLPTNSLDSDQDRHFVGPDLDPNCLILWYS